MAEIAAEPDSQIPEHENSLRVVWALAWPAVALNSLGTVNSLLDSGFIGHLATSSMTAYGGAAPVLFLLFSLAMAIATGATAIVSRAFGAGHADEFRTACRQALSLSLMCGLVLAAVGMATTGLAAKLMLPADAGQAAPIMRSFLVMFSTSLPALFLIQALAASLRGIGDTKSPMVISGVQILLHMTLNFILIFPPKHAGGGIVIPGFNMGLPGGGLAMSISSWVSAIAYLAWSGRTPLGQVWRMGLPTLAWVTRLMKIATPAAFMAFMRVASFGVFTIILAKTAMGNTALAAMRPGFAIESVMFMPSFGISMAAAALVGQSLGMKRPDRAERLGWVSAHSAAIMTLALAVPVFLLADQIANLMILNKPEVASETALLLRYLAVTEVGFAYAMVMLGALQGAGDTVMPLWITVFSLWVLRVPLTWVLVHTFSFGTTGAWFAMSLTQLVQGALSVAAFKRGRWKLKQV